MTAMTILLGNLRLVGEACQCPGDSCTMMDVIFPSGGYAKIHRDELAQLQSVAAVVEAAKEWRRTYANPFTLEGTAEHRQSNFALAAAIDTLTAGGEK